MPGLRERNKARTRAEIRRQALRLIREQGYAATTVEQIAAAAEVSQSTFFRYFPTKEEVVLTPDQVAKESERHRLIQSVPELRARNFDTLTQVLYRLADAVAERIGRSPDELPVRVFAGALVGIFLAITLPPPQSLENQIKLVDAALAQLEAGLPL